MGLLHAGGTPRIYGDGSQTRDYVFVEDVVDSMLVALDNDGGVFNIGTGVETSVLELYDAIRRASEVEREPAFAEARLGELQRSVLDTSLAERALGWRPSHSLDEGLARTWAWIVQE
jgi:UDP-glucose 4-epimerase